MAPTDRAAYYHLLRVYLQIVLWKVLDCKEIQLDPREWGWQCKNGHNSSTITITVKPVQTTTSIR